MTINRRVLLVDDSITATKQLAKIIDGMEGFEVVARARHGAEGLKLYHSMDPDLVCMDIVMPVMDGLQAARAILQANDQAKIVMVTSLGGVASKADEALRMGVKDVISKPFETARVEAALRKLWPSTV